MSVGSEATGSTPQGDGQSTRSDRGLTVLEVLVAMVIVAVGIVGVLVVVPISVYGLREGRDLSTATFLAEARLEDVRSAAWQAYNPGHPAHVPLDCLGTSAGDAAPTSRGCGQPDAAGCTWGTPCVTFPDESPVPRFDGYMRAVRVRDCGPGAGCGGLADDVMRLVTVTVTYRPLTGVGVATTPKTTALSLLVSRR